MKCEDRSHLTPSLCSQEGLSMTITSLWHPREGLPRSHSYPHMSAVVGGVTNLHPLSCSPQAALVTKCHEAPCHSERCQTSSNVLFCPFRSLCTRTSSFHGGWPWTRERCRSSLLSSASHDDVS